VKTGESQNELKRRLVQQFQVYNVIREIERPLIDRVIQKCNGNPL
jgi:DNA-binding protein Fis